MATCPRSSARLFTAPVLACAAFLALLVGCFACPSFEDKDFDDDKSGVVTTTTTTNPDGSTTQPEATTTTQTGGTTTSSTQSTTSTQPGTTTTTTAGSSTTTTTAGTTTTTGATTTTTGGSSTTTTTAGTTTTTGATTTTTGGTTTTGATSTTTTVTTTTSTTSTTITEIEWISISAGSFNMGCVALDLECNNDEKPSHNVTISAFQIAKTEITQEQWIKEMGPNPSHFTPCPKCPVEKVTWEDADDFCDAVGGRLPTEAEWEYAARGGTNVKFGCGGTQFCLNDIAWWSDNATSTTHEAALLDANGFGLFDMYGNVFEWVNDWYKNDYYGSSPGSDPPGPATGSERVYRGGAWPSGSADMRASARFRAGPTASSNQLGFRCAKAAAGAGADEDSDPDEFIIEF